MHARIQQSLWIYNIQTDCTHDAYWSATYMRLCNNAYLRIHVPPLSNFNTTTVTITHTVIAIYYTGVGCLFFYNQKL